MGNIKISLLFLFAVFLYGCTVNSAIHAEDPIQKENRFYEETGGFSLILPHGWEVGESQRSKFKVLADSSRDKIVLGIMFLDLYTGNSVSEMLDGYINDVIKPEAGSTLLARREFISDSNLKGEKIITIVEVKEQRSRQIIYCLPGSQIKKIFAMCTILGGVTDDSFDNIFDSILKTFEWTPITVNDTQVENRFYEPRGGFSVVLLKGWHVTENPGIEYKIITKFGNEEMRPFLMFAIAKYAGVLDNYVDMLLKNISTTFKEDIVILNRSEFYLHNGTRGIKTLTKFNDSGQQLRQILYTFPGPGNKIINITCIVEEIAGDKFDKDFDSLVKTFEWTN